MEPIEVLGDDAANSLEVRLADDQIVLAGHLDDDATDFEFPLSVIEAADLRAALGAAVEVASSAD